MLTLATHAARLTSHAFQLSWLTSSVQELQASRRLSASVVRQQARRIDRLEAELAIALAQVEELSRQHDQAVTLLAGLARDFAQFYPAPCRKES